MPIPTSISEIPESWVSAIGGTIFGFLSNFLLEWYKKKSKKETDAVVIGQIASAANQSVLTAKELMDIMDERSERDTKYYEELIERAKEDCQLSISKMKSEYDEKIEKLKSEIVKTNEEKAELLKKVEELTKDKNSLQQEVTELKNRLQRYENGQNSQ